MNPETAQAIVRWCDIGIQSLQALDDGEYIKQRVYRLVGELEDLRAAALLALPPDGDDIEF